MIRNAFALLRTAGIFLSAACLSLSAEKTLSGIRVLTPTASQNEKVEIALAAQGVFSNPFDPNEVTVDGIFTTPSGKQIRVPGFWFQDYRRSVEDPQTTGADRVESLTPIGKPEWRVRFSSAEVGQHQVVLELKDRQGIKRSAPVKFSVTAGSHPPVIHISPRNRSYLEDASGRVFFPIGENLCMYEKKEGTYYYDRLLERLATGGGNYVRLWQEYYVNQNMRVCGPGDGSFSGFPLETQVTGLGRYDLPSAWRLDYVSELCERLNIRWQLTFEMVVWWERKLAYRWSRNPYNAENGGPCVQPSDYLVNEKARELVKRRLRYSVGRWGWTTNLVAWELWNEIDNMDGFNSDACARWHKEMGAYLKQIDPWKHLVTTSWRDRQTFALPEIDIVQGHSYWGPEYDAAQYAMLDTDHLMRGFGKPFFFGEQGIEGPVSVDPEGKHFHDCAWVTALSGAAGTGLYWWWHNYVEPYNLYRHYKALARFVNGIDFPAHQWKQVRLSRPNLPVTLHVYGLVADDRALLWIHDPLAFRIVGGKVERGPKQTGANANVVGLADGDYEIEWVDTTTGDVIRKDKGNVRHLRHFGYGLELRLPEFWGDIAVRVMPVKRSSPTWH